MTCAEVRAVLVKNAGREATPEESDSAAAHARGCADCSSFARDVGRVWRWAGEATVSVEGPLLGTPDRPGPANLRGGLLYVAAAAALFLFVALVLVGPPNPGDQAAGGTDLYGDPLPPGAKARMGTVRLRGVRLMEYSPDGKNLISCDGEIRIWDAATGKERLRFKESKNISTFACSSDGKRIVSGGFDKSVRVWDSSTGKELLRLEGQDKEVEAVALSPGGKTVAAGGKGGRIRVWDADTGKPILELDGHKGGLWTLAYSPDGRTLASGGADRMLRLWNAEGGDALPPLKGHSDTVTCAAFSPDGKFLASGSEDRTIRLWDVAKGALIREFQADREFPPGEKEPEKIVGIAFSPDGRRIAAVSETHTIYLWDLPSGDLLRTFLEPIHRGASSSLATFVSFSADGRKLASGGFGEAGHIWDVESGEEDRLGLGASHQFHVSYVDVSPDGLLVASQSMDGSASVWEMRTGKQTFKFETAKTFAKFTAFSPDGTAMATIGKDGKIALYDVKAVRLSRKFEFDKCSALTFSPKGKTLAFVSDSKIHLLDIAEGKVRRSFGENFGLHDSLAFSPDGTILAAAGGHGKRTTIELWDAGAGQLLRELTGHANNITSVAFSPDGRVVASSSEDKTVRLWNPADGREIFRVKEAHWQRVQMVAFSPDGRVIASGGDDGIVRLWEVATGKMILELKGHDNWKWVWCVAFSPDGGSLVSGSADTTLLVWDLAPPGWNSNSKAKDVQSLWEDVRSDDAGRAYTAIWAFSRVPQEAIPFLKERLLSNYSQPKIQDRIRRLVADLDSDDVGTRESAFEELKRSGSEAEPVLDQALKGPSSPELRERATALRRALESPMPGSQDDLQRARAIWALEKMAAADVLRSVAAKSSASRDRRDAEAALRRLAR